MRKILLVVYNFVINNIAISGNQNVASGKIAPGLTGYFDINIDPSDTDEKDIIVDISEEDNDNINIDEELDQQIIEDVDKVYTTMKESDELEEISDSDLDLIDELNSDGDILEEYNGENNELSDANDDILEQPSESIIPERTSQKEENSEIL